MVQLSQNKKIVVAASFLFLVSFSFIWMFLNNKGAEFAVGKADLLNATNFEEEAHVDSSLEAATKSQSKGPIVVIDVAGEVKFVNAEFCELLAVDCEEFVGELFFDYISSGDLPGLVSGHSKLVQDGERIEGVGPYRMLKNEKEILVLFNAQPLLSKDGKVTEIVLSAKDLTDQVEAMQEENRPILNELYPRVLDRITFNK